MKKQKTPKRPTRLGNALFDVARDIARTEYAQRLEELQQQLSESASQRTDLFPIVREELGKSPHIKRVVKSSRYYLYGYSTNVGRVHELIRALDAGQGVIGVAILSDEPPSAPWWSCPESVYSKQALLIVRLNVNMLTAAQKKRLRKLWEPIRDTLAYEDKLSAELRTVQTLCDWLNPNPDARRFDSALTRAVLDSEAGQKILADMKNLVVEDLPALIARVVEDLRRAPSL